MPRKWYEGKIIDIIDASSTTKRFFVKILEEEVFEFRAGQFVTMDLPIGEKRLDRWRSYSIANAPDHSNMLEFCIVRTDPGHATKYLFEEASIGTTIKFKGPQGNFCLPKDLDKEIIFICTGTGVAPFKSMLDHINSQKLKFKSIHLIFGTRTEEGILYRSEFEAFQEEIRHFQYSIALSRSSLNGYQGYVHPIYMEQYAQTSDNRIFYICGWQNMVDEANKNLVNLGYKSDQIILELYG